MYTTLRPQCSYSYEYDDSLMHPRAIVLLIRAPTNSRAVVCVMRIQISDLSCVAFVCCPRQQDLDDIRHSCHANQALLRANPLGLLSIIYDHRARSWETWVTRLWLEVNQIEGLTRSSPPDWLIQDPALLQQMSMDRALMSLEAPLELRSFAATPLEELTNIDKLLPRLYTTDTEICHGQNVMAFGIRYANFCLEAVQAVDSARRSVGLPPQPPGARSLVEGRIRFTQSRCYSLQDRFAEMRERQGSQINASFSLIAQRESKISLDVARLVATDSRTMKTIGVLTLVFLPATLVTALWQANIFHLEDDINVKVYCVTTLAVTAMVFICWRVNMHFSRMPLHRFEDAPAAAGWPNV
ncbi:hypothetical protein CONLIGDRAFT_309053 [Coniochaeta ligniaria NRRL 30616]|uniref:Cora-domain-containing protein n=1 Tax=Coniochaeta ligniaria NRRL 30616 TaxID=1408157 RepID=A0A1J7JU73_9PEZI|nr:hypothetical protein CONLIGDRAFT_309053 [Coniochaeta ligniaria NRRL 30616]